jgi:hypothetical protein
MLVGADQQPHVTAEHSGRLFAGGDSRPASR